MSRDGRAPGFALLSVLWVLVFLGALAAEAHRVGSADRGATANLRATARARWAARGGMSHVLARLEGVLASDSADRLLGVGRDTLLPVLRLEQNEVEVVATVRDARARVQVNLAGAAELALLGEAAGLSPREAQGAAAAIVRWRAEVRAALPAAGGAGAGATVRALRSGAQPPQALHAVGDLRSIPHLSGAALARLAPLLTASGDGRINVNSAPAPVLRTLPGIDAATAAAIVRQRRIEPIAGIYQLAALLPQSGGAPDPEAMERLGERTAFSPRHVEIRVAARPRGSPVEVRIESTVALTGGRGLAVERTVEQ